MSQILNICVGMCIPAICAHAVSSQTGVNVGYPPTQTHMAADKQTDRQMDAAAVAASPQYLWGK